MAETIPKFCPQCGKEILGGFDNCVYCGWQGEIVEKDDRLEPYWYPAMWAMAFLLFPVGVAVGWRMAAVWQSRYPRKAVAMVRLNLTAHLVMLLLVIILSVALYQHLKPMVQSFLPSDFS